MGVSVRSNEAVKTWARRTKDHQLFHWQSVVGHDGAELRGRISGRNCEVNEMYMEESDCYSVLMSAKVCVLVTARIRPAVTASASGTSVRPYRQSGIPESNRARVEAFQSEVQPCGRGRVY
jgi:hypothetical protein